MKTCSKCRQSKPPEQFDRSKNRPDGRHPWCKDCQRAARQVYYPANRDRIQAQNRAWKAANLERYRSWQKSYDRQRMYGISKTEWDSLFLQQAGLCAICGRDLGASPHVDHDHETDEVRGLLCSLCNQGLGQFRDDITTLRQSIRYLQKWQRRTERRTERRQQFVTT